jgi:hypothetical protein
MVVIALDPLLLANIGMAERERRELVAVASSRHRSGVHDASLIF